MGKSNLTGRRINDGHFHNGSFRLFYRMRYRVRLTVAVEAAEQLYTGSGRGAEKKAYVVEFLNSKGFKIDAETLDKLIEAAVFNLPDYFTISGIPADTDSNKE